MVAPRCRVVGAQLVGQTGLHRLRFLVRQIDCAIPTGSIQGKEFMASRGLVKGLQTIEERFRGKIQCVIARLAQRYPSAQLQSLHQGREIVDVFQLVGDAVAVSFQVSRVNHGIRINLHIRFPVRPEANMIPVIFQIGGVRRSV